MKYFLLGLLFSYLCLPIIQNITSLIDTQTEYFIYKISAKTEKIKEDMAQPIEEQQTPIGFCLSPIEEYEQQKEEGDEEDYEYRKKTKRH